MARTVHGGGGADVVNWVGKGSGDKIWPGATMFARLETRCRGGLFVS